MRRFCPPWVIEAGSAPGLANLAVLNLPTSATAYVVNEVPVGTYYVRVRGVRAGVPGPSSNEVVVIVSAGCPTNVGRVDLRSSIVGSTVTLDWNFFGTRPFAWRLDVGSSPGLSDIALVDVPAERTQFVATAATGSYFVRIRRKSSCEPASNEVLVQPGIAGAQVCVVQLPSTGLIASQEEIVSFALPMPAACRWVAEPQEAWITLLTAQGVGGESLRFTVNNVPGDSGQIPITTSSGRYLVQVFQR
jgi:hypothetical protein